MAETTIFFESCLDRLKRGDLSARDELIERVSNRLIVLAERMMRRSPRVARWEGVDDLVQQALVRLHRCLGDIVPSTVDEFLRLGALQLRRELCDMARHHFGPQGHGANHDSHPHQGIHHSKSVQSVDPSDVNSTPQKLVLWTEFHSCIDTLPENEKRVFDLLWYHELSQSEAAKLLKVSERQLRRYWQSARLMLQRYLGESGLLE